MNTRDALIQLADELILEKGFNAFSFYDLAETIGIKTASIHYHFPTKTDLAIAVIERHRKGLEEIKKEYASKDPQTKLEAFLAVYSKNKKQGQVCFVGSLCTDLYSLDPLIQEKLSPVVKEILEWVTSILKEGKQKGVFHFSAAPRTKALLIITNMLGILQVSRITGKPDFDEIRNTILKELKTKKG